MLSTCGLSVQTFCTNLWVDSLVAHRAKSAIFGMGGKVLPYTHFYSQLSKKLTTLFLHYYTTITSVKLALCTYSTGLIKTTTINI